jgi:hypothetical protein
VRGLKTLAKYAGPALKVALSVLNVVDTIEMTESGISGQGWLLKAQVGQARALADAAAALVSAYDTGRFHADLLRLVETAQKNDEKFAELGVIADYWSTLDLSDFCQSASETLSEHVRISEQVLAAMKKVLEDAVLGERACDRILESIFAGEDIVGVPAFGARQDFRTLQDRLAGPTARLETHVAQARRDLDTMYDNIVQHGWLGL